MTHTTMRWLATATALAAVAAATPALAAQTRSRPRQLNATAYYGTLDVVARETLGLRARFFTIEGRPVARLPIAFVTTGERSFLCHATTDYNGYAECRNGPVPPPVSLLNLLINGYDATFEGNRLYAPVSAHNNIGVG